ncbi:MAG TPA: hypothetical protein VES65_10480 [Solirubrobacteraceae bacterium]|nr:hypothetical protein [Solirubrobacteraceae bacterium]
MTALGRISVELAMKKVLEQQNAQLLRELKKAAREIRALEEANANLRVELAAADALLGSAMDEVLSRGNG